MEADSAKETDVLEPGSASYLLQLPGEMEKENDEHVSSSTACATTDEEDEDDQDRHEDMTLALSIAALDDGMNGSQEFEAVVRDAAGDQTTVASSPEAPSILPDSISDRIFTQPLQHIEDGASEKNLLAPPTVSDETEAASMQLESTIDVASEKSDNHFPISSTELGPGVSRSSSSDTEGPVRSLKDALIDDAAHVASDNFNEAVEDDKLATSQDGVKLAPGPDPDKCATSNNDEKANGHAGFEAYRCLPETPGAPTSKGMAAGYGTEQKFSTADEKYLKADPNYNMQKVPFERARTDIQMAEAQSKVGDSLPASSATHSQSQFHASFSNAPRPLRWSVSVDGAIPPPHVTSLQEERHFSAPGAFRMYQTGVVPDEPSSERFVVPEPPRVPRSQSSTGTGTSSDIDISPPALRSAISDDSFVQVEAQLVRDTSHSERRRRPRRPDQEMDVVEAKPLDEAGFFRIRRLVLCVTMVVIVSIALGVGVWLGRRNKEVSATPLSPRVNSTATTAPMAPLHDQLNASLPYYTRKALKRKNSTQSKAFAWTKSHAGMANVTTVDRLLTRFALATLYYATGGNETWKDNTGWLTAAHECDWFVNEFYTACPDGESLTEIALAGNGLAGTLPAELGLLQRLTKLIVSSNDLKGTIPAQLAKASLLETLLLYDNQLQDFEGALSVVQGLKMLQVLDLEKNRFRGEVPPPGAFNHLTDLNSLYIGSNRLRGSIPSGYANLPSLTTLSLVELRLNGSIPESFAKMSDMETLSLYSNRLTGTISDALLEAWKQKMAFLYLAQNIFTGTISTKIGLLTSITSLNVFGNQFNGTLPTELGLLTQLTDFGFYANQFTGTIPTELGRLTNLMSLYLDGNSLTGTIPTELGELTDLQSIYFNGNRFSGTMPEGLCKLKKRNRYSGFDLNVNCDLVACDCDCTCVGDSPSRRLLRR